MIKTYVKRFRNQIVQKSILFSVFINSSFLVAFIMYLQSSKSKSGKKYTVLYLSKPVFNDDVKAIEEISDQLNFKRFPRLTLSIICRHFLTDFDKLNDGNYHVLIKEGQEVTKLRKFLKRVIINYKKLNHFDAVLAGNFVYTQLQELFVVLDDLKIPSVVIYKEGMLPIVKFKSAKDFLYKTKVFRANHIMFYNEMIRDTLIETQMKGLTPERASVIGLPRFDKYFNYKKEEEKKQIVLFSFEPNEKGNYLLDDKSKFELFQDQVIQFHLMFAQFCEMNPEYNLVVKTKGHHRAVNFANKIYAPFIDKLGSRLTITSAISAEQLIKESSYIAGFSSTTLIEALAINKPICCPKFSDTIMNKENDLLHPYQELGNYILELDEFNDILKKKTSVNNELKTKFIKERVFNDDGRSSYRAETCIVSCIEKYKS